MPNDSGSADAALKKALMREREGRSSQAGSAPAEQAKSIVDRAWRDGIAVLVRRLAGDVERAVAVHDDQYIGAIRLTVAELEREL